LDRRYFFKALASGLVAAVSPELFLPKLIKPAWKPARVDCLVIDQYRGIVRWDHACLEATLARYAILEEALRTLAVRSKTHHIARICIDGEVAHHLTRICINGESVGELS